jgi:hypothetical protein
VTLGAAVLIIASFREADPSKHSRRTNEQSGEHVGTQPEKQIVIESAGRTLASDDSSTSAPSGASASQRPGTTSHAQEANDGDHQ